MPRRTPRKGPCQAHRAGESPAPGDVRLGKGRGTLLATDVGDELLSTLAEHARWIRRESLRMIHAAGSGHPGGSLSAADVIAALFFHEMRYRADDPQWPDRDRFVLSKGHGVPALYAALARAGFFDVQMLSSLRRINSPLQGHPSVKDLPAVEASTGSLGQGLSIAAGMAMAGKMDGKDYRVYCLVGDGEIQEGQIWEAALSAPRWSLDNLTAIIDYNKFQLDDAIDSILPLEPLADKWAACGWDVQELDGHDMKAILDGLQRAKQVKDKPQVIIAHTVKGKGVSFMEHNNQFHGRAPSDEELARALAELEGDAGEAR